MDGLTTVQCGAHLLLQVVNSGTAFGKYVRRMVEPHGEEEQGRQRSVLPLPLKEDSLNELKKIIASGEYRRLATTSRLLEGLDLPENIPQPRVMGEDEEWERIGAELFKGGLVRPVDRCASLGGKKILNGAFGVVNPTRPLRAGRKYYDLSWTSVLATR